MPRSTWRLAVLACAVLAVALTGCGHKTHPKTPPAPAVLTVPVDGLDAGTVPDRTVTVPKAVVTQVAPRLEDDLRAPPAGTPAKQIEDAKAAADKIRETQTPLPTAGATAGFAGCRTSFVRNQSSRHGVRPQQMWDHYTVSPNVPGWADVNAVNALFDRASASASSNFILDSEGHCAYVVPIEAKAWTQASSNPFAISFEIIATGKESRYLEPAGMKKLAAVQKEVSRRTGIPLRRGAVSGCVPTRTGIVQHKDGGICSGGHVDIAPFSIDQVISDTLALAGVPQVTGVDRVTCRRLNWWRAAGRPSGKPAANAVRRRRALDARDVTCLKSGPVKR